MTCKCHPKSPFHWRDDPRPSIFYQDYTFRAKGADGKSGSQIATEFVESQRVVGKMSGTIPNLSIKDKELAVIAYKQFGIFSRARPNVKPSPNKHEK